LNDERAHLADALKAVTDRAPLITRGVVNASKSSRPLPWRRHELGMSISQTRALLDELMLYQVKLGWRDRPGDAA
jgi:hypothetical protein